MVKKRGLIIGITFVLVLACTNLYLFFNRGEISYNGLSGKFIEDIPQRIQNVNFSFIIFSLQWILLILIVIAVYSSFLKHKKDTLTQQDYRIIKQKKSKSETDLDVLYDLLKSKKKIGTSTIAKVFRITKDQALEWAKILEDHELVIIDYPTFRNPEVRINEKETEKEEEKCGKQEEDKRGKEIKKAGKKEKQKTKEIKKSK